MERINIPPVPAAFACPPRVPARKQFPVTLLRMHSAIDNMPMIEAPPDSQGWPDLGHDGGVGGGGSGPYQNPIPSLDPSALSTTVPHPDDTYFTPLTENEMPALPAFVLPALAPDEPTEAWVRPPADGIPLSEIVAATGADFSPNPEYLDRVRRQIMMGHDGLNFVDDRGYIIELANGEPTSRGEATYFTAVAATAIALGNYNADAWEAANANNVLAGFLDTLKDKSWGNMDSDGVEHPIRHPDWLEYDSAGNLLRRRPLNRDSFGQIVAAGYYAFHCPNSSEDVRSRAKSLIARWVEYLPPRGYRTHSNYITEFDEFETDGDDNFKHLFSTDKGGTISALGKDTFQLLAHELVALRRCADSMDIITSGILPLFETAWVALKALGGTAGELIAKKVREGMAHVLDAFDGEVSASWEVIPGWARSKIKVKAKLGIPRNLKDVILDYVYKAVYEYISIRLRNPEDLFLGQDELVRNLVIGVVGILPGYLQVLPLDEIVHDALGQILPVLDRNLLEDATVLTAAVLLAGTTAKDSSLAGFMFWNIAVALDAQPALVTFVKPPALAYLALIENAGNPNGMWGWLCGNDDVVVRQLNTFEAHEEGWTQYAYASTGYSEWVTSKLIGAGGESGHYSSRIDYLALLGFFEKGRPKPPKLTLKKLWEAVEDLIAGLLAEARAALESTGEFVEALRDAAGALVLKTINIQGTVMYETFDALGQTARFVANVNGDIQQTLWSLHDRIHYVHAVFARSIGDFIPAAESLIEFHLATDEAVCRVWQWAEGNVLKQFTKWELRVADGTLEFGKRLADQLRQADGRLVQRIYSLAGDVLLSYTVWGASTNLGKALWQDCLEIQIRDPAGVLSKWGYETGKILTGFSKWIRSNSDGFAAAADMVQKVTRSPTAAVDVVTFGIGGSLLDLRKWTTSSDVAGAVVAAVKDISLVRARNAASSALEEWIFDSGGVVRQYGKWATSLPNGAAEAVAQILRVVTLSGGAGFEINWFKDGVSVAAKVVDVLGKPIKDAIQGIADAIGGLFG